MGKQRIIGNIFCYKDDNGEYKTTNSIHMASWMKNIKWDGGKISYYIEETALWICNNMLEENKIDKG